MQDYRQRKQQIETSASSTNAVLRTLDGLPLIDDSGFVVGLSFSMGTDSENNGDWSIKSSTATSTSKSKFETSVIAGFLQDKNKMRSLCGKNLMHSAYGQQGKGRVQSTKKARGEQVKIEMENSHSSEQSDSQSSNFVFMQGSYLSAIGIQNERPKECEGNFDRTLGSKKEASEGHQGGYDRDGEGEYKGLSPEDMVADSSSEVNGERSENHGSSRDQDPIVESIFTLQSAQEVLEKELLLFKDINKDISVESVSDLHIEFIDADLNIQQTSSELSPYRESVQRQSEVVEETSKYIETEYEDLFKQKIETEVEYLVISRGVEKLRIAPVNQITVLQAQKALVSEHKQMFNKLRDAENRAMMLQKEAKKLESVCEDNVIADETMKLQNEVCKYTWCVLLQIVLLVVIVAVFMYRISHNYIQPAPT